MLHTSTKSELLSLIKKMLKALNSFGIGKSDQSMVQSPCKTLANLSEGDIKK